MADPVEVDNRRAQESWLAGEKTHDHTAASGYETARLEKKHGITLPQDYADVLTKFSSEVSIDLGRIGPHTMLQRKDGGVYLAG